MSPSQTQRKWKSEKREKEETVYNSLYFVSGAGSTWQVWEIELKIHSIYEIVCLLRLLSKNGCGEREWKCFMLIQILWNVNGGDY